jgi:hypothetical protein
VKSQKKTFAKTALRFGGNHYLSWIENIVIIIMLGIISIFTLPSFTASTMEFVCKTNRGQIERYYEAHLDLNNLQHSDVMFSAFLGTYDKAICPKYGEIEYREGIVVCKVHGGGE